MTTSPRADVTIEPLLPDAETQALLEISPRQAALFMRMTDADVDGRLIMIADCIYRGDRYQLSAHVPARANASARPAMQATVAAR